MLSQGYLYSQTGDVMILLSVFTNLVIIDSFYLFQSCDVMGNFSFVTNL